MFAHPTTRKSNPATSFLPSRPAQEAKTSKHHALGNQATLRLLSQQHQSEQLQLQRKCASCEEEEKHTVNRFATGTPKRSAVPPIVHTVLSSSGRPLDRATRSYFEPRFGHDLSRVRVHTGALAAESATAVEALAYTVGHHLVFNANQFSPDTQAGRRLLAHELSHVVQQSRSAKPPAGISHPGDSHELDAERQADRILSSPVSASHAAPLAHSHTAPAEGALQRYAVPGNLKCSELVNWLASSSPYAPEWAQTACDYSFNGNLDVTPPKTSGGKVSLTAKGNANLTVSANCPTDLPDWTPSASPNLAADSAAWSSMIATLDAHEARHRAIGQTWQATLETKFKATSVTATGTDQADAMTNLQQAINDMQQKWIASAQAAQSAIDPFRGAILTCPPPTTAPPTPTPPVPSPGKQNP